MLLLQDQWLHEAPCRPVSENLGLVFIYESIYFSAAQLYIAPIAYSRAERPEMEIQMNYDCLELRTAHEPVVHTSSKAFAFALIRHSHELVNQRKVPPSSCHHLNLLLA